MGLMQVRLRLQTKIMLLVVAVVAVALWVTELLIAPSVEKDIRNGVGQKALSVARLVAAAPVVVGGLAGTASQSDLQAYTVQSANASAVEFIVVFDMQRMRKAHPDIQKVGQPFVGGDEGPALQGQEYVSVARGTLGDSLRAFVPVYDAAHQQIGVVSVGILMNDVQGRVQRMEQNVLVAMGIGLLVGMAGAVMLAGNVKQTLFGLEPAAIAKLLEERSAMLQSAHEGVLAVDSGGRISLMNAAARRLLSLTGNEQEPEGEALAVYWPEHPLLRVLASGQEELEVEHEFYGVTLLMNVRPVIVQERSVGAIAVFRDKTEVKRLAEQLTGVRDYVDALRAQAHEFMNQLHVILGLVKLESYEQLASYINHLASKQQAEVSFVSKRLRDPVLAGFLLSKLSLARERGITMRLSEDSYVPLPQQEEVTHELVTIIGNLVENAFDALRGAVRREVDVQLCWEADELMIAVEDTGAGIATEIRETIFYKGVSTKSGNRGFGLHLVAESVKLLGGHIEAYSPPQRGACFVVEVPYVAKGNQHD